MNNVTKISIGALVLMGLGVVGVGIMASNSNTDVVRAYFDNGTDQAVKIELDGKPAVELAAHSGKVYESLAVGDHKVRVMGDGGKLIEEAAINAPSVKGLTFHKWVYNVQKASHYKVRYLAYGNAKPPASQDLPDGQQWFELPTTSAIFLPAEPAAEKSKAATTLAVVGHRQVHEKEACCANLRALMK
jgi:hypothetical protein